MQRKLFKQHAPLAWNDISKADNCFAFDAVTLEYASKALLSNTYGQSLISIHVADESSNLIHLNDVYNIRRAGRIMLQKLYKRPAPFLKDNFPLQG